MVQATHFQVDPTWRLLLKSAGAEEKEVLLKAGLSPNLFAIKNAKLSVDEYYNFWDVVMEASGDPLLPLNLGRSIRTEEFSPPIFAAFCSPNLNIALQRMSKYKQLVGPKVIHVDVNEECTTVTMENLYKEKPAPGYLVAAEFVFLVQLVRLATREEIVPIGIRSDNDHIFHDDYIKYFKVSPNTANQNQLIFSAEDAQKPFLTENEAMWNFFKPMLNSRLKELEEEANFAAKVSHSLFELLPSGEFSVDVVARNLAVSKRTLQRNLNKENTSFQKELNNTREKLANHYLKNSTMSNSEISFMLGYEDTNSFFRAFRSWTGLTPEEVRSLVVTV